jgi:UDP-4-amino-4,6-dideoxy-N-acetyl-beta-L-altrosamine N-acetyltransferase
MKNMAFQAEATLRKIEIKDHDRLFTWRNDPGIRRYMFTSHEITAEEHEAWFISALEGKRGLCMIAMEDGTPIGYVNFADIKHKDGTGYFGLYKAPEAPRGRGMMIERACLRYAFETLGLNKISAEIISFNDAAFDLHAKFGFKTEGVFKDAHMFEGARYDIHRLALFAADWKSKQ